MQNDKSRKVLITILSIAIVALLIASYYLYSSYSETAPAMLSQISLFFSNCVVLMLGVLLILSLNGFYITENRSHKYSIGVILIFATLIGAIIYICMRLCQTICGITCGMPIASADNSWCQSVLIPTVVSAILSVGLALISDSVCSLPCKGKERQREMLERHTNESTFSPITIRVHTHLTTSSIPRYRRKKQKSKGKGKISSGISCRRRHSS